MLLRKSSPCDDVAVISMKHGFFLLAVLAAMLGVALADETKKEVVLFDGKTLDDWKSHDAGGSGEVLVKDGELRIGMGDSITGAIYQKAAELPVTNYEISLEAKRLEGLDFFVGLTFPVGDLKTCATLVMGGWGGSVTGLSSIDDMDASENSTGHYRRYDNNKWYAVRLQVTPETIKVFCDNEMIINADIKGKKVNLRYGAIEEFAPLSLTTYQTEAAIRNIKLRPLEKEKK
jgi:hypothetical protein